MPTATLEETIQQAIEQHSAPLLEEKAKIEARLAEIDSELQSTGDQAMRALVKAGIAKAPKGKSKVKASSGAGGSSGKSKVSDAEATDVLTKLAKDNPGIAVGDLATLAKDSLADKGYESRGLVQRLKKIINSHDSFAVDGEKVSVAA